MRSFFKNLRNCSPPVLGVHHRLKPVLGYIFHHWNWMNSYWMFWIGCLSWIFSVSRFCDFWKITFCNFTTFFSILTLAIFFSSDVLNKEYLSLSVSQIWLSLMWWILVSAALKKWCFFWRSVCTLTHKSLHSNQSSFGKRSDLIWEWLLVDCRNLWLNVFFVKVQRAKSVYSILGNLSKDTTSLLTCYRNRQECD